MSLIVFKCLLSVELSITLSARDVIPTQNALKRLQQRQGCTHT